MSHRVNLCIFNHPREHILDQIWFAQETFSHNGYEVLCTDTLRPDCLNLLIENFIESDADIIGAFCRRFGKQIGIVMTEHIELEKEGMFSFAGVSLTQSEYIGNKEQRLFSLLSLTDCVFGFFTFGELPELRTWGDIVPTHGMHRLPYPSIGKVADRLAQPDYDIVFTGTMTQYRESVLGQMGKNYRVVQSSVRETEPERAELYTRSKIAVNIPQDEGWKWISPMRILFGLRCGVPTVHLGHRDMTMLSRLVMEPIDLQNAVRDHDALFQRQISNYEEFVKSKYNSRFPSGMFDIWRELELL